MKNDIKSKLKKIKGALRTGEQPKRTQIFKDKKKDSIKKWNQDD